MTDVTRRKALAWAVPVVLVAVATPLAAASQPPASEVIVKLVAKLADTGLDPNGPITLVVAAALVLVVGVGLIGEFARAGRKQ